MQRGEGSRLFEAIGALYVTSNKCETPIKGKNGHAIKLRFEETWRLARLKHLYPTSLRCKKSVRKGGKRREGDGFFRGERTALSPIVKSRVGWRDPEMEPFYRGIKRNSAQSGDKLSPLFSSERRGDHASMRFPAFSNLILRLIF